MKKLLHKIIQIMAAILIFCIVGYSIVYAQQVCCNTVADAYIPAFKILSSTYNIDNPFIFSPPQNVDYNLKPNIYFKNNPADCGSGNSCCQTDHCDNYNQLTEFPLSFVHNFYLHKKNFSLWVTDNGAQNANQPYNFSTPHKAVPIYILKESIIC